MKFFKRRNPKKKRLAKAGKFVLSAFLFRERFIAIPILLGLIVVASYFAFQPQIQEEIPPQAASVNNVQSGTVTMNSATETATITAVDPARSIVFCSFRTNSSNASNSATCDLTNATTVTVETGAANGSEIVQWHVVQFDTDVSVMRGSVNFGTGDTVQNVTLAPAVDTTKAFAIVTSRTTSTSQVIDEQRVVAAEITSGSNLQLTRAESGIAVDVEWQVVTINDATVQSGTTTISDTATSNTATITSVDTAKSFVVFSALPDATVNGIENSYYATGVLTNSTTLTFTRRGTTGDLDLHWFVVEMSDGTSVQRGTATEGSTGTSINQSITSVDTSVSVPIVSTNVIETGNPTGTADQDSGNWTGTLTSGTNLQLQRGSAQDRPSDIAWQVVEFDVAPPVADWSACRTEGGETTIPASSASSDLTLSTSISDLTQAFLLVDSSGTSGVQGGNDHMVSGYILDANTLRFERGLATATEVNVSYALVECFNNEFDVQRGEITIAASGTSNTGTITSVSQPDSLVLVNARTDDTANAEDEALVTGELLNPTTVTVQRAVAGAAATQVRYEVVEFQTHANVSVQTGEVTLTSGNASVTDTISSVDTGSSWLFCSWDASNNGLQQTAIGCDLTNATTVTFHRFGATAYTNRIRYYVVEFPTGEVTVQRGTEVNDPGSADDTRYNNDITISPIQSVTKAFPFVTNTTSGTGSAFPRNKWIEFLTSITNLRTSFWRGANTGAFDDNTKYWQVVEFAAATNTEPTGSFNSTTGSSGNITVSIEVDDADDDDTRAKIEYETDSDGACNGPWADATLLAPATADFNDSGGAPDVNNGNPYQVGSTATTRIITSSGSNTVDFGWDSATDLPGVNGTQCLRLTANDDSADQTTPDTTTLTVDNTAMLSQQAYRWFANDDSTDVGSPMAAQDTITRLTRVNEQFRLRVLLDPDTVVNPSDLDLKLQFAEVGSDFSCDTSFVGETYADVTGSSLIAFADNPTPADGDTATANVNDPTDGSETVIMASYEELNNATNPNTIAANQDGLWDFSLQNNGAVKGQVYCFRVVRASGSTLSSYSVIPQLRTLPDVYVHCDAINELQTLDTVTGTRTVIGTQTVSTIEAIAYDSGVDLIYAADSGDFGTLDHFTGAWTLISEIDGGGCADGAAGCIALNDVDGLALDAQTRILWGSHRTGSGSPDLLFQINPSTGQFIPDAFGTDVDYLEIGGTGVYNLVDDIAIRPSDGEMFTTGNNGSLDQLLNINKNTGAITVVTGIDTTDFEGSDYRNDDTLMGVRGFANEYREINDSTGVTSNTISLASGPVCGDPEAIAALTLPANRIFGTVFEDNSPQNGTLDGGELGISGVTVRLFVDNDLDGEVDGTDTLVQTTVTDGSGNFSFFYGTTANLVMEIDTNTLPSGYALTTDNLEGAIFTDAVNFGETDTGNNFGANTSSDCDSDGIPDFVEDVPTNVDSDGDGVINACDIDSDNDGITDTIEFTNDRDEDGVPNYLDLDSDNDGIPDAIEANGGTPPTGYSSSTGRISGTDTDLDGLVDNYDSLPSTQYGGSTTTLPMTSTDCSVQDWLDGDSDDDGILDIVEAGGTDSDGDGFVDSFTDANSDGYHDPFTTTPLPIPNTDGTGGFNYQDLDSDGDGIVDFREGQSTAGYSVPGIIQDADGDGVADAFDSSQGGTAIDPVDTDTDGDDDYVDTDSDDDGVLDSIEGHDSDMNGVADVTPSGTDADGDGIDDAYDTDTTGSACFNDSTEVNTVLQNTDGTDEIDWRDTNDDNDGFLTIDEDFNTNNDWSDDFTQGGSPTPDYLFFTTPVDISVTKVVDNGTPDEGDTVQYTVTVTNTGPITATGIEVTDLLPAGVTYVSDTPSQGSYVSGTGVWTIGTLIVSASATIDIDATVDAGQAGNLITNTATLTAVVQGDSNPANDSDTADITVRDADLAVTKIVDDATPNVGDTITYTVTIANNGPDDATNVVLTDLLPSGVTYVSDTPSQGSYVSGTGVWTVGTINNGANATLDITATVDVGEGGNTINNAAAITSVDQGDSVPGNDSDDVDVVVQAADLSLTKTVDNGNPGEGATIVYTITVTNGGPDSATGVTVQDLLPSGVTYVSDTPSQGSYVSGTGVWTVGTIANAANATLDITATVDAGTSGQTIDNDAEVQAADQEDPDSTPGNSSGSEDDEDTASISVTEADLSLTKTVNNAVPNVGDTIVYTVTVTNAGPDDAIGVEVTDLLPAGVTYVSDTPSQGSYVSGTGVWTVGTINNGANATLDITATVDAGTGGTIINNAAEISDADTGDPDSTPGNTSGTEDDEDDVDIDVQAADLNVVKIVDDATPNEGDAIVFTVTLTNNGPDSATNIVLTDLLPAGVTYVTDLASQGSYVSGTGVWSVGTIANGANATLDITATVDAGTAGSLITNTATVTSVDQEDPSPGDESDTADITVQAADLTVTKTVDDATPNVGDTIVYTVTVANGGPDNATNVVLTDALPAGVTYVSDTPSQGSYVSGTGVWTIGTINNGANATLDITATVDAGTGGTIIGNTATVTGVDQADPNPGDESDDEDIDVQAADLTVTKTVDDSSPNEGGTIIYTLTVANGGPDSATNVVVTDLLPAGVTYVSDTPSQGSYVSGTGVWTIGTINNGANATLDITATVDAGTGGTIIGNTATVTGVDQEDPNPGDESDDEDIDVQSADLSLSKVVDVSTPNEGDTVVYTISIFNAGPDQATGVSVLDQLPAGVTFVSDTPSQGSYTAGTGIWNVGILNASTGATLDITATVDVGTSGQTIVNDAEVSAADQADPDSTPGNSSGSEDDEDDASITVQQADLSLTKTVDNATPNTGDTIVYTITVANGGPDSATNVVVTDLLPAGVTYVSDTPSQGSYVSGTGVWTVGTIANAANATLDITATVDAGTGGTIVGNSAEVTSVDQADPDSTPGNTSGTEDDEDSQDIDVQAADLTLTKTVDNATPNTGDTIVYTITVVNGGPDSATNVVVTDLLPAGVTYVSDTPSQGSYVSGTGVWTVGTIANAANATLDITATVDAGTGGTIIGNTATVTGVDQEDPNPGDESDDEDIDVQAADLALTKVVNDATPNVGDSVTYTITVSNAGPDSATNVTVQDLLPAGVTYVSDTPSQGSYVSGTGVWTVGTIANAANATLDITATVDAGQGGNTINNAAEVSASDQEDGDSTPGNTSGTEDDEDDVDITVESADLSVTKTVDDSTPNEADTIVYTITVANGGPDSATNVVVTDLLPAGVTYVSDTPSQGSYVSGTGVWTVGTIANAANATLDITATVDAGTGGTIIGNTATVTGVDQEDPNPGDESDDEDIDVQSADLELTKVVDNATPNEGDTIVYTVTVTNNGPDSATGVTVADLLPAGVTFVSATESQGGYTSIGGIWTVGTIANGGNATLDITATVDASTAGQTIVNNAEVSAADQADPDSTPGNTSGSEDDEDSASLTVTNADLAVVKVVDDATPDPTDTIVYTITVSNNGPDDTTGVEVTDLLPAGVTYVSDTPSQGSYVSGTGVWTVGSLTNGANATLDITATVDAGTGGTVIDNVATVTGSDQSDSNPANNSDNALIDVRGADVGVTKSVDDAMPNEGDTIVYTITVTNNGPDDTTGVEVTDLLPAGVTYVSDTPSQGSYVSGTGVWTVGSLTNGANATLDITATVDAGTATQTINNQADITGNDLEDGNTANDSDDVDITVSGSDLAVTKSVDDSNPNVGDTIVYTVTVTNNGPNPTTAVEVTDLLPAGVTYVSDTPSQGSYVSGTGVWTVGVIPVAGNATLDITATVDAGQAGNTIQNTATLTDSTPVDPIPGNNSDDADITVQSIDIAIVKTVDDSSPNEGDTVVFTITATNNGPSNATTVVVSDLLPAGVTYVSDTPSQGSYVSGTGVWTVGTIANAANATLDITATVDAGTSGTVITNTATFTSADQEDTNGANDSDAAQLDVQQADISVVKNVSDSTPNVGDTITYTITINNNGPDQATNIEITDLLPAGVTYVSDTPSQGSYVSGTGVWSAGTLPVSSMATLQITATVDAGQGGNTIVNTATLTDLDQTDTNASNNSDSANITVEAADLTVTKTVDNATPSVGDTIVYTVTIANGGPDSATNIVLTDLLPAGVTYVSDTPSQGSYVSGTGVWTVGTIANAANATLDITATVDAGQGGNTINNAAAITSVDQEDPNPGDEDDDQDITVQVVDLELSKSVDDATPNEGDTIVFTVTVSNNGPDSATGVEVTDLLPAGVTYVSDTPSQGSYVPGTGVWTVGTVANAANATLDITVTVDAGTSGTTIDNDAEVSAQDQEDTDSVPGNSSGTEDDEDSASISVEQADLWVVKEVDDATPNEGDTIQYTITLINQGPNNATNVELTDQLPAGVTYVSHTQLGGGTYTPGTGVWDVGSLPASTFVELYITATVDAGTSGSTITNTATVTNVDQADPDTGNNTDDADITVEQADLALTKVVDDATPNVGQSVLFTITVANTGPDSATNVTVQDLLPTGLTYVSDTSSQGSYVSGTGVWTVGTIANGANATLDITATVDAGQAGNTIVNNAEVSAADQADPDSTPGNTSGTEDDEDAASLTVQSADLNVVKTVDNGTPTEGDTITYTVTVTNNGPDQATNVVLTDSLPAGVTYVSDTPSQGSYNDGSGLWTIGNINNGANATLDITATVDAGTGGTVIGNTATVTGVDQEDPNPGDESDDEDIDVQAADLELTKGVDDSTPNVGDTITYTVTVTNNGPDSATNVAVADLLPAGVTYVSDTPSQGSYVSGTGVWTVGTIANAANATLDITATVDAGQGGNTINNAAEVSAADQADPDSTPGNTSGTEDDEDDVDITVESADLTVIKTVDSSTPNEGDTIVYTIIVANGGPDSATSVVVTDVLPPGVTYVSDTPSQGSYVSGTGVWTVGTIADAANATLDITATVDAGTGGTIIGNTATVTGVDQEDPNPGDESDDEDIDVQAADLEITKTIDNASPNVGDTITYSITVSNGGPDTATNVTVADLLPAGLTYVSDTPSQGSYVSGTGVWTVGTIANAANATLDITATVDAGQGGNTIVNSAEVSAADQADPDSTPGNTSGTEDDEDTASLTVRSADLNVVKTVDNSTPTEGDVVVYSIVISNNGPDQATGVVLTDLLPAGVTYVSDTPSQGTYVSGTGVWTVGTIANAANATLAITATVDAGTGGTIIGNTATVTGVDQEDPNPGDESDDEDIDVQLIDLELDISVNNATPNEGEVIVYTVTVSNQGPDGATGVTIEDVLPAGVTFISSSASQGSYDDTTGVWTLGSLGNGASETLDVNVTVDAGTAGTIINNAAQVETANQVDVDSVPGNSSGTEDDEDEVAIDVQQVDLELDIAVDNASPDELDTITYTITLVNQGPDTATNVSVTDLLPAGVTYVSDTPSQGSYVSGTGVWTVGTLANGATATLDITATVDAGTAGTIIVNSAEVEAQDQTDVDSIPGNTSGTEDDEDEVSIGINAVDLAVNKTVDDATVGEEEEVTYTITVTNNGPDTATDVELTDALATGISYVSDTPSQGVYTSGTGVWEIGTIPVSGSVNLQITAITDPDTDGETIVNTSSITALTQTDPNPANDSDDESIQVREGGGGSPPEIPTPEETTGGIVVNNGAACTADPDVDVMLTAVDAVDVIYSTDPSFIGASWQAFTSPTTVSLNLEEADAENTVYARFRSRTNNLSSIVSDDIVWDSEGSCTLPPTPPEEPGEPEQPEEPEIPTGGSCPIDCDRLFYDVWIINPDGSRRHMESNFARYTDISPTVREISFEDKGEDFDYNDVFVRVDKRDCTSITFDLELGDARWHHQVGVTLFYEGTNNRQEIVLWDDSQVSEGSRTFVNANDYPDICVEPEPGEILCDLDCDRVLYELYIKNPDGSVRRQNTNFATVEEFGDGTASVRFEDKGEDFDYNDVLVNVNKNDCSAITFDLELGDARWDHEVWVDLLYAGTTNRNEVMLWSSSQQGTGTRTLVNSYDYPDLCLERIELEEPCRIDCDRLSYDLYITNPDGTERHMGTEFTIIDEIEPGYEIIRFEDRGLDVDHNDVVVAVDRRRCDAIAVEVLEVNAGWHHQISMQLFYEGSTHQVDELLFADSHLAVGAGISIDANEFPALCEGAVVPRFGSCTTDCSRVTYDLYIENPDGTERHMFDETFARIIDNGDNTQQVQFEDSGFFDFDYNDVWVDVNRQECENIIFQVQNVDAGWHHKIKVDLYYDGVKKREVTLWEDSHLALNDGRVVNTNDYPDLCLETVFSGAAQQTVVTNLAEVGLVGEPEIIDAFQPQIGGVTVQFEQPRIYSFARAVGVRVRDMISRLVAPAASAPPVQVEEVSAPAQVPEVEPVVEFQPELEPEEPVEPEPEQELESEPPEEVSAVTSGCVIESDLTQFLDVGVVSNDVLAMQNLLQCLGYFPDDVAPNAVFGPATQQAVINFQADNGIDPVGYVGPSTRAALNAYK